jgi:hypothetical protein
MNKEKLIENIKKVFVNEIPFETLEEYKQGKKEACMGHSSSKLYDFVQAHPLCYCLEDDKGWFIGFKDNHVFSICEHNDSLFMSASYFMEFLNKEFSLVHEWQDTTDPIYAVLREGVE